MTVEGRVFCFFSFYQRLFGRLHRPHGLLSSGLRSSIGTPTVTNLMYLDHEKSSLRILDDN